MRTWLGLAALVLDDGAGTAVAWPGVDVANGVRTVETGAAGPDGTGLGPGVLVEEITIGRAVAGAVASGFVPPQPDVTTIRAATTVSSPFT